MNTRNVSIEKATLLSAQICEWLTEYGVYEVTETANFFDLKRKAEKTIAALDAENSNGDQHAFATKQFYWAALNDLCDLKISMLHPDEFRKQGRGAARNAAEAAITFYEYKNSNPASPDFLDQIERKKAQKVIESILND